MKLGDINKTKLADLPPLSQEPPPPKKGQPKLTVELVPETCWFTNLRSELRQADWERLKKQAAARANHRCEICGGKGPKWPVECHEIWHYDDSKWIQQLRGVIALCPACHEVKHFGFAQLQGHEQRALAHLAKINGWTQHQACTYVQEQADIWAKRSTQHWQLDCSWLNSLGIKLKSRQK